MADQILVGEDFHALPRKFRDMGDGSFAEIIYNAGAAGGTATGVPTVINVKDAPYGAAGDGVTNDTTAVQAALTAAGAAGGGIVYFPAGTYQIASSLTVPSKVILMGAGKKSSILRKSANTANGLLDFSGASNASRGTGGGAFKLKLDGAGFTGPFIRLKWCDHFDFENLWLFNNADVMLYLENCWDTTFFKVEHDTCTRFDGFGPMTLISSNADDSSNMITFDTCRWENFADGSIWFSSGPLVSAYTCATGANPVYKVAVINCKVETTQLRGVGINMSADVSAIDFDGGYYDFRGLYSGISTGRTIFNIIGANDIRVQNLRVLINGVTNPTASTVFSYNTNARGLVLSNILCDIVQNPSTALISVLGGTPDLLVTNVSTKSGQTPTMFSGTWPPAVASAAALTIPKNPGVVSVTGTTSVTSMTADLPGRVVTLTFTGILTFTLGSNLKLASSFTTAAGSSITLVCDGTNWYEIGRKA